MIIKMPFPKVIDATMMNNLRNCQQKFYMKDVLEYKGKGESVHLLAGAAFAAGLERARRSFYEGGTDADTALAHGIRTLMEHYGTFEPPEFGSGSAKTLDRMCGALEYYFAEWPLGQGAEPHVMPSGKRAIEFSFAQPLPVVHPESGEPLIYAGRSDMICDFADGVYIEDDKTATQLGESWVLQWDLRSQFTGYCWAARESGISVAGVLVRGVSILKTKYGRADALTYRASWEIDRWLDQTCRDLQRAIRAWEQGHWDWALDDACNNYGGCCFRKVCKSPDPNGWLRMDFERRHWDPLERKETLLEPL